MVEECLTCLSPYCVSCNPHKHLSMKEETIKLTDLQSKQCCSRFMLGQIRLREGPVPPLEPRIGAPSHCRTVPASVDPDPSAVCPDRNLVAPRLPLKVKRSTACSALRVQEPGSGPYLRCSDSWLLASLQK